MEKFNIRILKRNPEKTGKKFYKPGRITIGDFTERFWMPLDYWSLDQYEKQWKEGIARIKTHDTSCLVVRIDMSEGELYVGAWVLYKVKGSIIFQYHFYPDEDKTNKLPYFNSKTCYLHIRPWKDVKDKYEQWEISMADFFASQKQVSTKKSKK